MFNIAVNDNNGNTYNFICEYFSENFDNNTKRQDLIFYRNNNIPTTFVEDYALLQNVEIENIIVTETLNGVENQIAEYSNYNKLATAIVTCREAMQDTPETEPKGAIFQGIATFRK